MQISEQRKVIHNWTIGPHPSLPAGGYASWFGDYSEVISDEPLTFSLPTDSIVYEGKSAREWHKLLRDGDATTRAVGVKVKSYSFHGPNGSYDYEQLISDGGNGCKFAHTYQFSGPPVAGDLGNIADLYRDVDGTVDDNLPMDGVFDVSSFRRAAKEDFSARLVKEATFSGGIFFADLHKTREMIRKRTIPLLERGEEFGKELTRQDLNRLERYFGSPRERKRAIKKTTGLYLELQYGWRPLVGDFEDAVKTATDFISNRNNYHEKSAHLDRRFQKTLRDESNFVSGAVPGGVYIKQQVLETLESEVKFSAAISHKFQGDLMKMMATLGFAPRDIAVTAWDFQKFSFVLDYFFKVNNMLEYRPDAKSRIRYCSATYRDTLKYQEDLQYVSPSATDLGAAGWLSTEVVGFKRRPEPEIGTLLIPHLRVPKPLQGLNLAVLATHLNFH